MGIILCVENAPLDCHRPHTLTPKVLNCADVIASLLLGIIFIFSFLLWEHLLVKLRYFTLRPLVSVEPKPFST